MAGEDGDDYYLGGRGFLVLVWGVSNSFLDTHTLMRRITWSRIN